MSYNNGLWTPDELLTTPAATSAAETPLETEADLETTTTEAILAGTTTSAAVAVTKTSSDAVTAAPTTTPATLPVLQTSSTSSTVLMTPGPATLSAEQDTVTPSTSSSTSTSLSLPVSSAASSLSSMSSSATSVASALPGSLSSASTSGGGLDIKLLIPVFVLGPILILAIVLGLTHGRCWGKRKHRSNYDSSSYWFGGRGSLPRKPRKNMFADEDEDEDGFVEGKFVGGSHDNDDDDAELDPWDEKAAMGPYAARNPPKDGGLNRSNSMWTVLKRGLSNASRLRRGPSQRVRASRPPMEEPFVPPQNSNPAFGLPSVQIGNAAPSGQWNYVVRPEPTIAEESSNSLTAWGWGQSKYRAKSMSSSRSSSIRSQISARLFGRNDIVPPSPSIYSPIVRQTGAYAGLDGEDIDEANEEDLDAYLGESRVGDSHLARRYLGGETELANGPMMTTSGPSRRMDEYRARDDYQSRHAPAQGPPTAYSDFVRQAGMTMPTPPRFTHSSPTKASAGAGLLRQPPAVGSPNRPGLLFQYDSPPVRSSYQPDPGPLISVSPERKTTAPPSPRPPLPQPPQPRQSLFQSPQREPASSPLRSRPLYAQPSSGADVFSSKPLPDPRPRQLVEAQSPYPQESLASLPGSVVFGGDQTDEFARRNQISSPSPPVQRPRATSFGKSKTPPPSVPPRNPLRRVTPPSTPGAAGTADVFNPKFSDAPPLPPLQHPSRVKNAVYNLEARVKEEQAAVASSQSPPSSPRPVAAAEASSSAQPPRSRPSSLAYADDGEDSPALRSTGVASRVLGGRAMYSRPVKGADGDEDDDDDASTEINEASVFATRARERANNDRIGSMLLERRRTAEWNATGSDNAAAAVREASRPLSSDPKRLSGMLRRGSAGSALGRPKWDEADDE